MKSKRYKKLAEENQKFEVVSPYNFCDRWCERCTHEKQMRCKLYLDDLERRATCIAHGKTEDDLEITQAVLEKQYEGIEEKLEETAKKFNIGLDNLGDLDEEDFDEEQRVELEDLPKEIQEHIQFVKNHPLPPTADQYCDRAHAFLEAVFKKQDFAADLKYNLEIVAWYYTLLPAKLDRALAGFHEPLDEYEFGLCDAIAQFEICRKAAEESINALKKIYPHLPSHQKQITQLIALLHNIHSRIVAMEESI